MSSASPMPAGRCCVAKRSSACAGRPSESRRKRLKDKAKRERKGGAAVRPEDKPLADALRAYRAKLAAETNVPPYVIFPDVTLREVALFRPRTTNS